VTHLYLRSTNTIPSFVSDVMHRKRLTIASGALRKEAGQHVADEVDEPAAFAKATAYQGGRAYKSGIMFATRSRLLPVSFPENAVAVA
jgi:hypothetical protein